MHRFSALGIRRTLTHRSFGKRSGPRFAGWSRCSARKHEPVDLDLHRHDERETFLVPFTKPGHAEAFRTIGLLIDEMAREYREYWPAVDFTPRRELRAALADLRHLEGYLGRYLGTAYPFAAEIAERVREVADRLDRGLRNRKRFEP